MNRLVLRDRVAFALLGLLAVSACERRAYELPVEEPDASTADAMLTDADVLSDGSTSDAPPPVDLGLPDLAVTDERCDGVDNDGDGLVDSDDPSLEAAPCLTLGVCADPELVMATCRGRLGWQCLYASDETSPLTAKLGNAQLEPEEADDDPTNDCDDLDNDCDGRTDEAFPTKGAPCSAGLGACRAEGTFVCGTDGASLVCSAIAGEPTAETCNGLDDDCDGLVDEGAENDDWVTVGTGPSAFRIFAHEASRPDATAGSAGATTSRACGASARLPWTNVTYDEAEAACAALDVVGAHLCTESEWETACESGTGACAYPYATSCDGYAAGVCNDAGYDADPSTDGTQAAILPGGDLATCAASWGSSAVYDLAGNASEWTAADDEGVIAIRGGSNTTPAGEGTRCTHDFFVTTDRSFFFGNLGFRCCAPL